MDKKTSLLDVVDGIAELQKTYMMTLFLEKRVFPVSYTHLDVYKRQP